MASRIINNRLFLYDYLDVCVRECVCVHVCVPDGSANIVKLGERERERETETEREGERESSWVGVSESIGMWASISDPVWYALKVVLCKYMYVPELANGSCALFSGVEFLPLLLSCDENEKGSIAM